MPEPTIEQLLKYMDRIDPAMPDYCKADNKAIRAILEQHRRFNRVEPIIAQHLERSEHAIKLDAIRAFVERVEKRWITAGTPYGSAVQEELAAMAKETNADNS